MAGVKVSIVVDHKDMYQKAIYAFEGVKVKDYFSVILISAKERKIVEEYCIPRIDGVEKSILSFDEYKEEADSDE